MKELWISTNSYNFMLNNVEDRIIKAIRHDIKGVEIAFSSTEECLNYEPSKKIIEELKKFKVSIEAPELDYSKENKIMIEKLKRLYNSLNGCFISFKLTNNFDSDFVLQNFKDYELCIKNQSLNLESIDDLSLQNQEYLSKLKLVLNKGFNFSLDICNSISLGVEFLSDFILNFKENIINIHWAYIGNKVNHNAISSFREEFNILLNTINLFEKPLIIEIVLIPNLPKRFVIRKEINFLKKNWLNKNEKKDVESNICFDLWIDKISQNYSPERINEHVIKHFNEKEFGSINWIASAENLINIYHKVKGINDEDFKFVKECTLITSEFKKINNVSVKDKLVRLLIHYMKYTKESTPPPTKDLFNLN